MNRRLVNVYVVVSQAQNGRTTNHSDRPAQRATQTTSRDVGAVAVAQPVAGTPPTARQHDQHQQRQQQRLDVGAGGDDDVLALVQQLAGDGHGPNHVTERPVAHVDHVARADRDRRRPRSSTTSRPPASTSTARPVERVAAGQVDADLAADGRAAPRVRRRAGPRPRRPPSQLSYRLSQLGEDRRAAGRSGPGPHPLERQRRGRRHRQLVRASSTTLSRRRPRRPGRSGVSTRSTRMPATLRSPTSTSLGHFRPASRPRGASAVGHGEPGQQRQPRPAVRLAPRAGAAPRTSARPGPASPRCGRAGRGRRSGARRRPPARPAPARARVRDERRWWIGALVERPRRASAGRARREPVAVERWACGEWLRSRALH